MSTRNPWSHRHFLRRLALRPGCANPLLLSLTLTVLSLSPTLFGEANLADKIAPIRIGFSSQIFTDLNESDARAALKIWAQTLGAEVGIPADDNIAIYPDIDSAKSALIACTVDAVSLSTPEYWSLKKIIPTGRLLLGRRNGEVTTTYVLLIHNENPAKTLADLRGKNFIRQQGANASLGKTWEETLLLEARLGPTDSFWGSTTTSSKLTRIVLPVFFRQSDACIVTLDGFRTMCELNPQVGARLKIIAQSPAVVANVFFFRANVDPRLPEKIFTRGTQITSTPSGRQILALFQSEKLLEGRPEDMAASFDLLERHARLHAATNNPTPPPPVTAPPKVDAPPGP